MPGCCLPAMGKDPTGPGSFSDRKRGGGASPLRSEVARRRFLAAFPSPHGSCSFLKGAPLRPETGSGSVVVGRGLLT